MKGNHNSRRDAKRKQLTILILVIAISCISFLVLQQSVDNVESINEHHEVTPISDKSKVSVGGDTSTKQHSILNNSSSDKRTLEDFKLQNGCAAMKIRPVHDDATWKIFRETYYSVVGEKLSTIGDRLSTDNAFRFQISARQSPGKGRGIFAEEEIPEGEILYDFSRTAQFQTGDAFRKFLDKLPNPLACDVLMWSYVQSFTNNESENEYRSSLRICTDLDPGSFCNDGGRSDGSMAWEENNEAYNPVTNNQGVKISSPLISLRKILINEEIMCNYGQFSEGDWGAFGLY